MRRSLMKQSPIWTILGLVLLVAAAVLVVTAFLNPGQATPEPGNQPTEIATAVSTATSAEAEAETEAEAEPEVEASSSEPSSELGSTTESVAAKVNGYTITQDYLSQTVRLNTVLGKLSGASTLDEKETLDRLVRSQLILQGVTDIEEPSGEEVEDFISALERNWGVSDEDVVEELEAVGLERVFLKETIKRLLTVQAGVESLEADGHNISEWLIEQEENANIMVSEDLAEESPEASPIAEETDEVEPPTSTPGPQPEVPEVASNFTLKQAGGGSFTLNEQLEKGPVALIFFQRCG
jgi:hypothetical protein